MFNVEIFWNFITGMKKNIFCLLSDFPWNIFPGGWGDPEKLKKGGGSMVEGQIFLKRGEGEEAATFPI